MVMVNDKLARVVRDVLRRQGTIDTVREAEALLADSALPGQELLKMVTGVPSLEMLNRLADEPLIHQAIAEVLD